MGGSLIPMSFIGMGMAQVGKLSKSIGIGPCLVPCQSAALE